MRTVSLSFYLVLKLPKVAQQGSWGYMSIHDCPAVFSRLQAKSRHESPFGPTSPRKAARAETGGKQTWQQYCAHKDARLPNVLMKSAAPRHIVLADLDFLRRQICYHALRAGQSRQQRCCRQASKSVQKMRMAISSATLCLQFRIIQPTCRSISQSRRARTLVNGAKRPMHGLSIALQVKRAPRSPRMIVEDHCASACVVSSATEVAGASWSYRLAECLIYSIQHPHDLTIQ